VFSILLELAQMLINNYQKIRFVNCVVASMFNTAANKKIVVLGFAFKPVIGEVIESACNV